jgi:hypothetical protein
VEYFESKASREFAYRCALLGCVQCGGPLHTPPSGDPFSSGPWIGRYLCDSCWNIYYSEHPEHLADQASVEYVNRQAAKARMEMAAKASEVLFKDGESRIILTPNGTLAFYLEKSDSLLAEEYDPARFLLLVRALRSVDEAKVPGYAFPAEEIKTISS